MVKRKPLPGRRSIEACGSSGQFECQKRTHSHPENNIETDRSISRRISTGARLIIMYTSIATYTYCESCTVQLRPTHIDQLSNKNYCQ